MKKTLLTLLMIFSAIALSSAATGKNGITNGSMWSDCSVNYEAEVHPDGSILFNGCSEGQDLAFLLTPKPGKTGEYLITNGPSDDCENPFSYSTLVKHVRKDGKNLLCFYDDKGRLREVISPLEYADAMLEGVWKRFCQLQGQYITSRGESLEIEGKDGMVIAGTHTPYINTTFNGFITGVIDIKGNSRFAGLWDTYVTPTGLTLCNVTTDSDYYQFFQPTGREEVLTWARKDIPRFEFASRELLNGNLLKNFDKSTLRLMRNEILFHHGYVPVSADLRAYLADKPWYKPRATNDGIYNELNVIETLNLELIKTAEALYDIYLPDQTTTDSYQEAPFDFEKYRQKMTEQAEANLNYMKSSDDIRLVSYALIDVDSDGRDEVWVRGDDGQDYQGVYAITPQDDVMLITSSDARSELHFYPSAVVAEGYYGEGEYREFFTTVKQSRPDASGFKYQQTQFSPQTYDEEVVDELYNINGKDVSSATYDAFIKKLGQPYEPSVVWHDVAANAAAKG